MSRYTHKYDFASTVRLCLRRLETLGVDVSKRLDCEVTAHVYPDHGTQMLAWSYETAIYAMRGAARGCRESACRGLVQLAGYLPQATGYTCDLSDIMATLKNLVEHMILIDIGKVPIEIASDLHACAITHADGIVHVDRDAMSAMWAADRAQYEADMAAYYAAQRKVA